MVGFLTPVKAHLFPLAEAFFGHFGDAWHFRKPRAEALILGAPIRQPVELVNCSRNLRHRERAKGP
eukprot:CAMPEP_0179098452 /NCGR_PEP_ID=MMETSP0796-20121207/45371_1 /TAXON_ID=73915 /ORGANISM="Pyrodinium bahamense, Strain pbaha01" /LENGTH=65 /DNA_ID=CAMNT_0020796231 /DNA_START=1122 /DNA_END=1315 /DNA_ORIENTATION=-